MDKPIITKDKVKTLFETRFIKLFDLQYADGKHYFDATRHELDDITALKTDEEFKNMLPDAVTCFVILNIKNEEPKLLLSYEYRYPTGQFLLSPAAGLIDKEDRDAENPQIVTAIREIYEETGIEVKPTDKVEVVSPLCFSTPGMTDESNALVSAVIELDNLDSLNQNGAVGSERFNGFKLLTKDEAREVLKAGRDEYGNFFSVYTWAALCYFVSDMWK